MGVVSYIDVVGVDFWDGELDCVEGVVEVLGLGG